MSSTLQSAATRAVVRGGSSCSRQMYTPLLADVGLPMIFVQWPLALVGLVPVIVIEAFIIRRSLAVPTGRAFAAATKANLISTLAGVPLAWLMTLLVGGITVVPVIFAADKWHWNMPSPLFEVFSFVFGVAWIFPPDGKAWLIPLAAALLLVPTYFISVWIERPLYRRSLQGADAVCLDSAVRRANMFSYIMLFLVALAFCAWAAYSPP